jgi:ribosomal-protein-alanine N-acetyltransferase
MTRRNERFHRPWVHPPRTGAQFSAYLSRFADPRNIGLFVLSTEDDAIVGAIHFNEIVRGLFQSAYLGYYGSQAYAGRGRMREGMSLALHIGFRELGLHRVEANIQPENEASIRLVERLGFRREGYSPRYLKIGGRWKDHERWALLSEDWSRLRPQKATTAAETARGKKR